MLFLITGHCKLCRTGGNLADDNADLVNDIGDENNITYIMPAMGGLTLGASYKDAGDDAAANADETVFAAKYAMTALLRVHYIMVTTLLAVQTLVTDQQTQLLWV